MVQHDNVFARLSRRVIVWAALILGSGLAVGVLETSAIARHAEEGD